MNNSICILLIATLMLSFKEKPKKSKSLVLSKNVSTNMYGKGVMDIDGNLYKTVVIGKQEWMAENLKVSKYNDGTAIPNLSDEIEWQNNTTGAWCYYNNDNSNNATYGKLYNWYTIDVTQNDMKFVCPAGWHVPSSEEWTILIDYLGGDTLAGGKMKEVGFQNWSQPNSYASNTSLFTALPSGYRNEEGKFKKTLGKGVFWWAFSEKDTYKANLRFVSCTDNEVFNRCFKKESGLSIRCLKN